MGHFMEKIATNFFAHTPPPKFFELFNNQIFIPSPIGTLPATSNSRARALPTIQRMAVANIVPTIMDMAYNNHANIKQA